MFYEERYKKNGFPPIQQTVKACIISSELCEQKLET